MYRNFFPHTQKTQGFVINYSSLVFDNASAPDSPAFVSAGGEKKWKTVSLADGKETPSTLSPCHNKPLPG